MRLTALTLALVSLAACAQPKPGADPFPDLEFEFPAMVAVDAETDDNGFATLDLQVGLDPRELPEDATATLLVVIQDDTAGLDSTEGWFEVDEHTMTALFGEGLSLQTNVLADCDHAEAWCSETHTLSLSGDPGRVLAGAAMLELTIPGEDGPEPVSITSEVRIAP